MLHKHLISRRFLWGLAVLAAGGLATLAHQLIPGPAVDPARAPDGEAELARIALEYARKPASDLLSLDELRAHPDLIRTHRHPLLGRPAPDLRLTDHQGKTWALADLLDAGPVVLVFYQGFSCVHCVRHLFDLNRDLPWFRQLGAQVIAVSSDPAELTRQRFQQYGAFGFPLLSDAGWRTARAYGLFRNPRDACPRHGTFVIDRAGVVRWVNAGDAPFRRNRALLSQLASMGGRATQKK